MSDTPDIPTAILKEIVALRSEMGLMRAEIRAMRDAGRRRILSLNAAARLYGTDTRKLRMLFDAGQIEGREIPGRGKSGRELRLSTASLDRLFGITP